MRKEYIPISTNDNDEVQTIYARQTSICNMLAYLSQYYPEKSSLLDEQWAKAIKLDIALEEIKTKISDKYCPDNKKYIGYHFDFINSQLVYEYDS